MLADLDLLLTAVFCTADDLLPEGRETPVEVDRCGGRHPLRGAVDHGVTSDERFVRTAAKTSSPPVPEA